MAQVLPEHRAREYETIFILHPDTPVDAIEQVAGRLTDVVENLKGKLIRAENWGRRRLAYLVRKQQKGIYIYLRYLGYSDLVNELERVMRMLEPILKYLTVKLEEDVNPDARPTEDISFLPSFPEDHEVAKGRVESEESEAVDEDFDDTSDDDDEPESEDDLEDNDDEDEADISEDGDADDAPNDEE